MTSTLPADGQFLHNIKHHHYKCKPVFTPAVSTLSSRTLQPRQLTAARTPSQGLPSPRPPLDFLTSARPSQAAAPLPCSRCRLSGSLLPPFPPTGLLRQLTAPLLAWSQPLLRPRTRPRPPFGHRVVPALVQNRIWLCTLAVHGCTPSVCLHSGSRQASINDTLINTFLIWRCYKICFGYHAMCSYSGRGKWTMRFYFLTSLK